MNPVLFAILLAAQNARSPLTPEAERATFTLPPGFEVELVAAESEGVGKFITVAWDPEGRLWTMTALEYPVDANEDPRRAAALFKEGGRDKVLVFDDAGRPRVWAEGLAIPLGLLPYKDGAFVQYGSELRFYRDRDGDGRADGFETVLRGFGIEDSHLFIHQFTRGPGGWIYMAQGAFNRTRVKTREGHEVRWDFCKMARMQPDGSRFELCQAGLNNIWGFVITREGEMFIQEANDMGYPVAPFPVGANYPGIGMEKLKPYAPWQPALASFQMGGTGLSGLAKSEDRDAWPAPYADVFYVANPITRRVQAIRVHPDGPRHRLEKLPDFLLSSDEWFRPIAIHFGPDGCLYVVDWYNKVISHNEVPRNHPERDKTRGRIWRVRHKDQPRRKPSPDLASPNAWEARTAWMSIVDRNETGREAELDAIANDRSRPADLRLRGLWALEGLGKLRAATLKALAGEPDRNLRREAVRAAAALPAGELLALADPLAEDPDPQVRAEVIRSVGPRPEAVRLLAAMGKGPLEGKSGAAHEREFERYLVRAALERHPAAVEALLDSGAELPAENRLLASLSLAPRASAARVAALLPRVGRPPTDEELLRLVEFPEVAGEGIKTILRAPGALEALLRIRNRLDAGRLSPVLTEAARELWTRDRNLALRLAAAFKLVGLEEELAREATPAAVRALREIGSAKVELFAELAKRPELREEALLALASAPGGRGAALFLGLAGEMHARERKAGVGALVSMRAGAAAVVGGFKDGTLPLSDFDGPLLEKLQAVLGDDPALRALLEANAALFRPVLLLDGKKGSFAEAKVSLPGAFTVEAWVRLEKGVTNADVLLGSPTANINFHDGKPRFWAGPRHGDVVVAKKPVAAGAWTHLAVVREATGRFRIHRDGELDAEGTKEVAEPFEKMDVGSGTAGLVTELRVWDRARSAEEIRASFDRAFEGEALPAGLVHYHGSRWGRLHGGARVVRTTDFPALLSGEEARRQEEKFERFRGLAGKAGDAARGREVFAATCAACHAAEGKGGQIGPTLNGAGAMGTEALLRNLLTPNASMEPGYRVFRVATRDGDVLDGFLVSQDAEALLLRRPGAEDRRLPHKDVLQAGYARRSMMPEGLLEALPDAKVADLFAYLRSLK